MSFCGFRFTPVSISCLPCYFGSGSYITSFQLGLMCLKLFILLLFRPGDLSDLPVVCPFLSRSDILISCCVRCSLGSIGCCMCFSISFISSLDLGLTGSLGSSSVFISLGINCIGLSL